MKALDGGGGPFRRRALVLLAVIVLFAGAYVVLEFGGLETSREVSSLVMPVRVQYESPLVKPTGLAFDGEYLWISSADEGAICKMEPATGALLLSLDVGIEDPWGMAWDGSRLWVSDFDTRCVYCVDVEEAVIVSSIPAPGVSPTGLTWDGMHIVVSDFEAHKVFRLDPVSGAVVNEFTVPQPGYNPSGLAWNGEHLWVSDISASYVFKLDPVNGSSLAYYYSSGYYPSDLAWEDGYLWMLDYSTSMVYKTEPGERAVETKSVGVPTWFFLAFFLTITPILMSTLSALKERPTTEAPPEGDDFRTVGAVLHMVAILGSIYTGYELFRIIYSVVFLDKIVFRGGSPLYVYRFEMLLCLYTLAYWVIYAAYHGLKSLRKMRG